MAALVTDFANMLTPPLGNAAKLTHWIGQARVQDLPFLHSYATGVERAPAAVAAALATP
ncbi:hypothetical protein [Kitasatospora xanthocidica]|uniref:hypothetical protein n=1 Tax=Kitasatospora xanthocidica TaxID=83382 RepID=UPI0015F34213|nr:hypothetical protein [Kitasatospora xanthocidica]